MPQAERSVISSASVQPAACIAAWMSFSLPSKARLTGSPRMPSPVLVRPMK